MQRVMVISYQRFVTTYSSHLQDLSLEGGTQWRTECWEGLEVFGLPTPEIPKALQNHAKQPDCENC